MDTHTFFVFAMLFIVASSGFYLMTTTPAGLFIEQTPAFDGELQAHTVTTQPAPPGTVFTGKLADSMCKAHGYENPCDADKRCPRISVTFDVWDVRYCCCQ